MSSLRDGAGPNPPANQAGLLLGFSVLAALADLLIAYFAVGGTAPGPWRAAPGNALLGLNCVAWGAVFLLNYYFSHRSLVFRGLIWFCRQFSAPSGRRMALAWFAFLVFVGMAMLLTGMGVL